MLLSCYGKQYALNYYKMLLIATPNTTILPCQHKQLNGISAFGMSFQNRQVEIASGNAQDLHSDPLDFDRG